MWNPFRKKNKNDQPQPNAQQPNRVDELANSLQREGRINELERKLKEFDRSSLSRPEQESWLHLYGIVAFQEGHDTEALDRFKEAYKNFPDSAQIRFSLGQQYIRTKDIEKGFELFRACKFPEVSREYSLAQARYAYLWNRYNDGLLFIRPFFDAYKKLRILDDHFLYVRGLPFFGRWWSYLAAFAILSADLKELEATTNYVVENCHDYDFEYLQAELRAYRDDKPEHLLEALEKRLANMPKGNFPTGYTRINIAVIKARMATTLEVAKEILSAVTLSENDFAWLEDIRTLAIAEAAHRLDAPEIESEQVKRFLARQPMLFEPDIALNFHLLRYQESLKPQVAAK